MLNDGAGLAVLRRKQISAPLKRGDLTPAQGTEGLVLRNKGWADLGIRYISTTSKVFTAKNSSHVESPVLSAFLCFWFGDMPGMGLGKKQRTGPMPFPSTVLGHPVTDSSTSPVLWLGSQRGHALVLPTDEVVGAVGRCGAGAWGGEPSGRLPGAGAR